ncbi:GGDEF domain-containing protein [Sutcliffiella cohnii]
MSKNVWMTFLSSCSLYSARKNKKSASIILFDIDYFKRVNDTYGHEAGDLVLVKISQLVKSCLIEEAISGSYGGEEFIINASNLSIDEVYSLAEKIGRNVLDHFIYYNGQAISVTSSFGISSIDFSINEGELKQLIREADEGLYKAKRNGRNRVELGRGTLLQEV